MTDRKHPAGVRELSALITTGTSPFGWSEAEHGVPEVVQRAVSEVGSGGVVAIARLAYDQPQAPRFADAERIVEWGISHYLSGRVTTGGIAPVAEAMADLMQYHYGIRMEAATRKIGHGVPWVRAVDWSIAAELAVEAGAVVFTQRRFERADGVEFEVDMFVCGGHETEALLGIDVSGVE